MAVFVGHPISMSCGSSLNDSSIYWKFQMFGQSDVHYIFNGYTMISEFSEFQAKSDGIFLLSTGEAQLKHAGTYWCTRIIGHHTKTYSAELMILGKSFMHLSTSNIACGSNACCLDSVSHSRTCRKSPFHLSLYSVI